MNGLRILLAVVVVAFALGAAWEVHARVHDGPTRICEGPKITCLKSRLTQPQGRHRPGWVDPVAFVIAAVGVAAGSVILASRTRQAPAV